MPGDIGRPQETYNAEDIDQAQVAAKAFALDFGAKYPNAVARIVDDLDVLLELGLLSNGTNLVPSPEDARHCSRVSGRSGGKSTRRSEPACYDAGCMGVVGEFGSASVRYTVGRETLNSSARSLMV